MPGKQLALILIFCLTSGLVDAQEIPLQDVLTALETPFKAINSAPPEKSAIHDFQASFYQQSRVASLDRVQQGEGEVSFKFVPQPGSERPLAMFRWEYRQPTIQEIVSDGKTMWVYVPENRQVIESDISQVNQQQGENPVSFLSGLGNLQRDFKVNWAEPRQDEDGNYILELVPKRSSQLIRSLQIVVATGAVAGQSAATPAAIIFPLLATLVTDPNDNQTRIEFRDTRTNLNLSADYFHFTPPEGVDVVRPSGEPVSQ